jgi:phosphate-selective porin OprO/OprP
LTITSEYIKTTLNRAGSQNLQFNGGYFMTPYFLTGEKYGYDSKLGLPTAPIIGNNGAWEIAGRYSTTDLNYKTVNGGKLNSYDLALNYYPNSHIRFMMDYIFNRTDSAAQVKSNPQYLMARMQVSF